MRTMITIAPTALLGREELVAVELPVVDVLELEETEEEEEEVDEEEAEAEAEVEEEAVVKLKVVEVEMDVETEEFEERIVVNINSCTRRELSR